MARRVILGRFTDGGIGLRVSKPGYDVMTNPIDNAQLMFSSDWASCLPIHWASGLFSIGVNQAVNLWYTDLGYIPFAAVVYQNPAGSAFVPISGGYNIAHYSPVSEALAVQALNDHVTVITNTKTPTLNVSIVVYKVRAW